MLFEPKGKQVEVLGMGVKGHFVVLGTAGSGKTTIALMRAINLSNLPGEGKVLLVTFNGALVEYMKGIDNSNHRNLTVENYHKFARGYLKSRGRMSEFGIILDDDQREVLIDSAVDYYRKNCPSESTYNRKNGFYYDEIRFIEEYGCDTLEKYTKIERTGRQDANLKREKRACVYQVYEKYIELRKRLQKQYDWYDLAMYVANELDHDDGNRRYKHIVVDEGQDFSPMMIKSLVKAIPGDGSFSFFGDVAQQIYGHRMSWRESGIIKPKIWRFGINYRNPETIVYFSKELQKSKYWVQDEYMVECEESNAVGPKPVLIRFESKDKEQEWVINRAIQEGLKSSVVIVCRNWSDIDDYASKLRKKGCNVVIIRKNTAGFCDRKQVYLSTFHSVKGLEFYNVFLPDITAERLPDHSLIEKAEDVLGVYEEELKLFYVAVTRSKYGLFMSYSGELTKLFPVGTDTVDVREM